MAVNDAEGPSRYDDVTEKGGDPKEYAERIGQTLLRNAGRKKLRDIKQWQIEQAQARRDG